MTSTALTSVRQALATALISCALPALSQTLLIDNFASPAPAVDPSASSQSYAVSTPGTYLGVSGQVRAAYYWLYLDPQASGATASIGNGALNVKAGPGAFGEVGLGYGAYGVDVGTQLNGPLLKLDLSAYNDLKLSFSHLDKPLNVIVGFYTSNPLAGSGPLYYWDGEKNIAPAADGGAVTADLLFKDVDRYPLYPSSLTSDQFNFGQVDGLVVIFDRAASAGGNSYSLTDLTLAAVPEPGSGGMLLAGLCALGLAARRRWSGDARRDH